MKQEMKTDGNYSKTQLKNKLNKIVALAVKGATQGERDSANDKLHRLCKKYSLRLSDYVQGLSGQFQYIDYRQKQQNKQSDSKAESTKTESNTKQSTNKQSSRKHKQSRRGLIIMYLVRNRRTDLTLKTLADLLTVYGYMDVKANKKAISGTLYDLQKQGKIKFVKKHDNGTLEVIL